MSTTKELIESIQSEIRAHEKNIRDYLTVHRQFDLVMHELLPIHQYVDVLIDIIKNFPPT